MEEHYHCPGCGISTEGYGWTVCDVPHYCPNCALSEKLTSDILRAETRAEAVRAAADLIALVRRSDYQ